MIIGAGPVGLSVILWCRFFGVRNIIVADLIEARAKAALNLGASSIAIPNEEMFWQRYRRVLEFLQVLYLIV